MPLGDPTIKVRAFAAATMKAANSLLGDQWTVVMTVYDATNGPGETTQSFSLASKPGVCLACLYTALGNQMRADFHPDDETHEGAIH